MAPSESTTVANSIEPPTTAEKQPVESTTSVREPSVEPQTEKGHLEVDATKDKRASKALTAAEDDDDFEYPGGLRLAAITTALCLSVYVPSQTPYLGGSH